MVIMEKEFPGKGFYLNLPSKRIYISEEGLRNFNDVDNTYLFHAMINMLQNIYYVLDINMQTFGISSNVGYLMLKEAEIHNVPNRELFDEFNRLILRVNQNLYLKDQRSFTDFDLILEGQMHALKIMDEMFHQNFEITEEGYIKKV